MNRLVRTVFAGLALWLAVTQPSVGNSQAEKVDAANSTITVRVYKSGFLSAFGHDHEIQAPIESGEVKVGDSPSVELRVAARKLRVLDPEASEKTRGQIQETMEGEKVLDVTRFSRDSLSIHWRRTKRVRPLDRAGHIGIAR